MSKLSLELSKNRLMLEGYQPQEHTHEPHLLAGVSQDPYVACFNILDGDLCTNGFQTILRV